MLGVFYNYDFHSVDSYFSVLFILDNIVNCYTLNFPADVVSLSQALTDILIRGIVVFIYHENIV